MTAIPERITANVAACIKAARLFDAGKVHEGYELIKNCTGKDLRDAANILESQAFLASKVMEIGKRHFHVKDTDPLGKVLMRAAKAGDADAKLMIACGVLNKPIY